MTQKEQAKKLNVSQSTIHRAKRDIEARDIIKPSVKCYLELEGLGAKVRAFENEIVNNIKKVK